MLLAVWVLWEYGGLLWDGVSVCVWEMYRNVCESIIIIGNSISIVCISIGVVRDSINVRSSLRLYHALDSYELPKCSPNYWHVRLLE